MSAITEQMCLEIEAIRDDYINQQVTRRIARRDGNATRAQIEEWEAEAAARWDQRFPSLAKLVAS